MDHVTFTHFAYGGDRLRIVFAPLHLALDRGYFRHEGIDLTVAPAPAPPYGWIRTAAQLSDIGSGYFSFASDPRYRGSMYAALVFDEHRPGHGFTHLLARRALLESGELRDAASLRGKRIGLLPERGDDYMAYHGVLAEAGLTLADVTVVPIPHAGPERDAALRDGTVDVVIARHPADILAELATGSVGIWKAGHELHPWLQANFLLFSQTFVRQRPETATRFCVAWLRGVRDYMDALEGDGDRALMLRSLERITGESRELLERRHPIYYPPNGAPDPTRLERDRAALIAAGRFDAAASVADVIAPEFALEAVARLGKRDEPAIPSALETHDYAIARREEP